MFITKILKPFQVNRRGDPKMKQLTNFNTYSKDTLKEDTLQRDEGWVMSSLASWEKI